MKINNSQNQNFGWHIKTHSAITAQALKQFPNLYKYEKQLMLGSQAPDIFLKKTSFIDSTAHNFHGKIDEYDTMDAFDFYSEIHGKSLRHLNFGINWLAAFEAGEALHYLQDVALPLHSSKKYNNILYILPHVRYEAIAKKNPALIANISDKTKISSFKANIYDIFFEAHNIASKMPHPFDSKNKIDWNKSVETSLENAYVATCNYLANISEYFFLKK